jgi:hypothetical protein
MQIIGTSSACARLVDRPEPLVVEEDAVGEPVKIIAPLKPSLGSASSPSADAFWIDGAWEPETAKRFGLA